MMATIPGTLCSWLKEEKHCLNLPLHLNLIQRKKGLIRTYSSEARISHKKIMRDKFLIFCFCKNFLSLFFTKDKKMSAFTKRLISFSNNVELSSHAHYIHYVH